MTKITPKDNLIVEVYHSFKSSMKQHGVQISLPTKTDPRKSYGWRYLSTFLDKCNKYGLDYTKAIEIVILNAKIKKSLRFGLSILNVPDLINLYKSKLERELQIESKVLNNLLKSDSFLHKKATGDSDLLKLMISRPNPRAYSNITSWYQANEININYIALSRKCMKAIQLVRDQDSDQLPSLNELLKIRLICQSDKLTLPKIKAILGKDLIEN